MSQEYKLVFVSVDREERSYLLSSQALAPIEEPAAAGSAAEILILPAAAALPFKVELPFDNQDKIARVLPQFVADIYSRVDNSWLFCWETRAADNDGDSKAGWQISGLAFPPEYAPQNFESGRGWRLAIADVFLTEILAGTALKLDTPVSQFIAVSGGNAEIKRIIRADVGVDLRMLLSASGISQLSQSDILADPAGLFKRLTKLVSTSHRLDLSSWRLERHRQLLRLGAGALVALVIFMVFISHFFLWFECYTTEAAAQRTRAYIAESFRQSFPGVPVVEPLTQVRSRIDQARTALSAVAAVPDAPWQSLFAAMASQGGESLRVTRLQARDNGFRISGSAEDYSSVEAFRQGLAANSMFEAVSAPELRQVSGLVSFTLEGKWRR